MTIAEQVKRSYTFGDTSRYASAGRGQESEFSHEKVAAVLEPRVDELCEYIKECIDHSGLHLDGSVNNIYLTGGGLEMMVGGRDYLSKQLQCTVRSVKDKATKFNKPYYSSALGLIDLVFGSLEDREGTQGFFGKISAFFHNLLRG